MVKESTFYFSHDYNAHADPKCAALIQDFGMEGYGLYWAIIETLYEQGGKMKKFPKLYDGLAHHLKIEKTKLTKQIEAMLHEYELLVEDGKYLWSDRVLRNLKQREAKNEAKKIAGQKGGLISGKNRTLRSKSKQHFKQNEANEPKERKGKEIKGKEITNTTALPTLADLVSPYESKYGKQMIAEFVSWWSEKNPGGKKERWQMQQVFDPSRRLATWHSRNQKPSVGTKSFSKKCAAGYEHPQGQECGHTLMRKSEPMGIGALIKK